MTPGPVRTVRELLAEVARGGRLIKREAHELNQANQWREWEIVQADGQRRHVWPRCAVAAHRKGMVSYEETR